MSITILVVIGIYAAIFIIAAILFLNLLALQRRKASPTLMPLYRYDPHRRSASFRSYTPSALPEILRSRAQGITPFTGYGVLRVQNGFLQGSSFPLNKDIMILGRSKKCDVYIPDLYASRLHARIERRPYGLFLVDMQSTNGTYLNGRRIYESILLNGDEILIGDTRFLVCIARS